MIADGPASPVATRQRRARSRRHSPRRWWRCARGAAPCGWRRSRSSRRGRPRAPAGCGRRAARRAGMGLACPRARAAAVERDAGPHQVEVIGAAPGRMPPELARLAGAGGSLARSSSKRCAALVHGMSGSSAQARWLITSVSVEGCQSSGAGGTAGRPPRRTCRAGSCRCRYARRGELRARARAQ